MGPVSMSQDLGAEVEGAEVEGQVEWTQVKGTESKRPSSQVQHQGFRIKWLMWRTKI